MIVEALGWYFESLAAFWVSLAGGGLFRLVLIACLIYWICCRKGRRGCHRCHRGCLHCGCRCGACSCGVGAEEGDTEADAADEPPLGA
jgi:hypothetical protein